MVSLKSLYVTVSLSAWLVVASNHTVNSNATIVTPDRMGTIPECKVCMSTLLESCYQKIATLPTQNSPSIDFMLKCICTPGYMDNFFNCGICSSKMMGSSKIPTEKDKDALNLLCLLSGFSSDNKNATATNSISVSTVTSLATNTDLPTPV